jgi:hypothetical protein
MFVIETQCYEDYGTRIKAKGGRSICCEVDTIEEAEAIASMISGEWEHILDIHEESDDWESWYVQSQKEYDDGVLYLDPVVRRSAKSGKYYLKRGYQLNRTTNPDFEHLVGKFIGWIDNVSEGGCVMKIEGDQRTYVDDNLEAVAA